MRSIKRFSGRDMRGSWLRGLLYVKPSGGSWKGLIAGAQRSGPSQYGIHLEDFSGGYNGSFIDTGCLVCYGLMSFITFQPSTRLLLSAGQEAVSPRIPDVTQEQLGAPRRRVPDLHRCWCHSRNQFLPEGYRFCESAFIFSS